MQIDFHHAVTYVAARIAGFKHEDADIIAYAAQYVDDAVCGGVVCFDNSALYSRISSAHKTIDPQNLDELENLLVWMPFHFLPGNGGADPGDDPEGSFIHKLVCLHDSPVAREMLAAANMDHAKPYGLHRLGIAMHVYADTWAHQDFAGVKNSINEVHDAEETDSSDVFENLGEEITTWLAEKFVPPMGHGQAKAFPDMPFLSWQYVNGHGKTVPRNNTDLFCEAADALCRAMQEYRRQTIPGLSVTGIGAADMGEIRSLFSGLKTADENARHFAWLQAIAGGRFSFGAAATFYAAEGEQSWKALALGSSEDEDEYPYADSFLTSNWKMFHDALQQHRLTVSHEILPRFGICAA